MATSWFGSNHPAGRVQAARVIVVHQSRREFLIFEVGGQRFGLPATMVHELLRAVAIVPLPSSPAIIEGVVDLRGQVVPVLDLRARLGLAAKALEPGDHLIVGRVRGRVVALRVDRALELVTSGAVGEGGDARAGVARLADGLAPILDLETLLSGAEAEAVGALLPAFAAEGEAEE